MEALRKHRCPRKERDVSHPAFRFALAAALLLAGSAAAQRSDVNNAMQATAPMKMTPPGESAPMRQCDKMAMDQHIKMEDRAHFVKDCVAKLMRKQAP